MQSIRGYTDCRATIYGGITDLLTVLVIYLLLRQLPMRRGIFDIFAPRETIDII